MKDLSPRLDSRIGVMFDQPTREAIASLITIPGVDRWTAEVCVAEWGTDHWRALLSIPIATAGLDQVPKPLRDEMLAAEAWQRSL